MDENGNPVFRFVVQDTGIGMSQEYLQQIFDPFSRSKDSAVNETQAQALECRSPTVLWR